MLRRRRCCSKEPTAIRNLTIPPPAPLWHRRISRWFPRVTSSWPSFPRLTVKPSGTLSFEPTGGAVSLAYLGERLARLEERGVKIALGPASITFGGQNRAVLVGSHSTTLRNCGELIQQPSGSMAMNSVVANFANSSKASSFNPDDVEVDLVVFRQLGALQFLGSDIRVKAGPPMAIRRAVHYP